MNYCLSKLGCIIICSLKNNLPMSVFVVLFNKWHPIGKATFIVLMALFQFTDSQFFNSLVYSLTILLYLRFSQLFSTIKYNDNTTIIYN